MSIVGRALRRATTAPSRKSADVLDFPWSLTPPEWWLRRGTGGDSRFALGVPALLAVLRAISGPASLCPLVVYTADEARSRARQSDQWRLLHDQPEPRVPAGRLVADAALSLAADGNWYARKIVVRNRVMRLVTLDPRTVCAERDAGEIVFRDRGNGRAGSAATFYPGEIVHARLAARNGDVSGLSPIGELRVSMSAALERRDFEQRVLQNDARPGMVFKSSTPPQTEDEADSWVERWMARHSGAENAGKPTIISVDDDVITIPVNLADLQFVEQNRYTREELAGVYQMPLAFVGADRSPTYEDRQALALFCLGPILGALAGALNADPEIFPTGSGVFCEPLYDAVLQTSARERYEAYRLARQGGWVTANELRARENLPAVDGGDQIQETPVGGAPNADPPAPPSTPA